jgi:hypothetical protein
MESRPADYKAERLLFPRFFFVLTSLSTCHKQLASDEIKNRGENQKRNHRQPIEFVPGIKRIIKFRNFVKYHRAAQKFRWQRTKIPASAPPAIIARREQKRLDFDQCSAMTFFFWLNYVRESLINLINTPALDSSDENRRGDGNRQI